ncbi:MAG: hypothetical protein FWC00_05490 [Firmicutes bacterium]|nr:hypothetical protein [Bacillota bacterium]
MTQEEFVKLYDAFKVLPEFKKDHIIYEKLKEFTFITQQAAKDLGAQCTELLVDPSVLKDIQDDDLHEGIFAHLCILENILGKTLYRVYEKGNKI